MEWGVTVKQCTFPFGGNENVGELNRSDGCIIM